MTTLTRAHHHLLSLLGEVGGSAELDRYGRLVAGPQRAPLAGDAPSWMVLVAHGLIAGEEGKVILTALGRAAVAAYRHGQVCEAR